jgi:hypothetical protein
MHVVRGWCVGGIRRIICQWSELTCGVQSNRIIHIGSGLASLVNLTELYLSENGIEEISGLETLV